MTERLSVLICTYNYARYLPLCLRSVLSQTHPADEIIVVDDGSTDGTPELIRQFPEVKYVYQQNAGKPVAFTRAVSLSTGDIICHLDADDLWDPHKLERVFRVLAENPGIGGVIHEIQYQDGSGRALHFAWENDHPNHPVLLTLDDAQDASFLYPLPKARGRFFGSPTTSCVRRAFLQDLLPLPPQLAGAVDGLIVAAALRYGLLYLPDCLAAYRVHGRNAGFGNSASTQGTICMWEFLLKHPQFRRFLSDRHANLLRAKILERKAYLSSRTGQQIFAGMYAGIRIPFILAANGYLCNAKHLALPLACILPIRRERAPMHAPVDSEPAAPSSAAMTGSRALEP